MLHLDGGLLDVNAEAFSCHTFPTHGGLTGRSAAMDHRTGFDPDATSGFSVDHMNTTQFETLIVHPDRDVRFRATMDAGVNHDPQVTSTLVARIGMEEDFHVRENITWALVQHGDPAMPAVLELLGSGNPRERRQAAHVLSKVGDPDHVPHLLPVVADPDGDVAIKAYRAAANTGSPDVVDALAARLGDGEGEQRDALSNAFQHLGTLGVAALTAALSDQSYAVRLHAAEALGQIGEDAQPAIPDLARLVADPDVDVALAAVMALGAVGGGAALAELKGVATTDAQPLAAVARRLINDAA